MNFACCHIVDILKPILKVILKPSAHGEESPRQSGMNVVLLRKNSRLMRMIFAEDILICVAEEKIYCV